MSKCLAVLPQLNNTKGGQETADRTSDGSDDFVPHWDAMPGWR